MTLEHHSTTYSGESEMMVLGCMLTDSHSFKIAAENLDDLDFYRQEHRTIFKVLKTASRANKPMDIHLVSEELKRLGTLASIGGVAYIAALATSVSTVIYIEEYITIVKEKSLQRKAIEFHMKQTHQLTQNPSEVLKIIDDSYQELGNLAKGYTPHNKASIGDILSGIKPSEPSSLIQKLRERQAYFKENNTPFLTGIPTGLHDLDRQVTLLEKTNLIIIAARPGVGKTALAL